MTKGILYLDLEERQISKGLLYFRTGAVMTKGLLYLVTGVVTTKGLSYLDLEEK